MLKPLFLTIAFLLEIGMLIAFFMWGFRQGSAVAIKYAYGIGAALLLAVFWGVFMSPKASFKIGFALKMAIEIVLFAAAVFMSYQIGYKKSAIFFGIATVFKEVLSLVYGE